MYLSFRGGGSHAGPLPLSLLVPSVLQLPGAPQAVLLLLPVWRLPCALG